MHLFAQGLRANSQVQMHMYNSINALRLHLFAKIEMNQFIYKPFEKTAIESRKYPIKSIYVDKRGFKIAKCIFKTFETSQNNKIRYS
jgi:hypothetical protein